MTVFDKNAVRLVSAVTSLPELDGHLRNALEPMPQDYMRRLNEGESAFAELQKLHVVTQRMNAIL